ncbi:hypothetical protein [Actinoplanes sp. L3-i22]|uniref:hypothetical protein n=1 Tax=Actinoplanes sp. L3-i22 TaxID=2836373 RepID=UPI001C8570BD|nr:hypothetical protein [Actinoplanes sp. L3-i22]
MIWENVELRLRELIEDPQFSHPDAARHALRFRDAGDVADLVAIVDDPGACAATELIFAMACQERLWLNLVPMANEVAVRIGTEVVLRRAKGENVDAARLVLSAGEPASALAAVQRAAGPIVIEVKAFPAPDLRVPARPGEFAVWRYRGSEPESAVPAPSAEAIRILHQVADGPWPSLLSAYGAATPLGELPLDDLLGLLAHAPEPPDNAANRFLATEDPLHWYRRLQPWVCLGILHHAKDEPWATSTRRRVLVDLAFGVEDWVTDAALFALVTATYQVEPQARAEVRALVRERLDAAVRAWRPVTIEVSLAFLLLFTPGATADDKAAGRAVLIRHAGGGRKRRPGRRRPRWLGGRD